MKIKCYSLHEGNKQILSEFANSSQRSFLDYQLKNGVKRAKKSERIQFEHTSNGVWYSKFLQKTNRTHLVLLSKQCASISLASSVISQAQELDQQKTSIYKFKMKISDTIKVTNANKKLDQVTNSVSQIQSIIKGNVDRIVTNMSDLQSVEKKSEIMTSLSLQFGKDSKRLQAKIKNKKCIAKIAIFGGLVMVTIFVIYFVFIL